MAADSVATIRNTFSHEIEGYIDNIQKIYKISKTNFGVSYWGLGGVEGKSVLEFFLNPVIVSSTSFFTMIANL